MLNNIVDNIEQYGHNIVQAYFQQLAILCRVDHAQNPDIQQLLRGLDHLNEHCYHCTRSRGRVVVNLFCHSAVLPRYVG